MFEIPIVIISYILLSMQGIGNYLLNSGPLSAWKQVFIGLLFVYALVRYITTRGALMVVCTVVATILIVNTLALGQPLAPTIYNIFFYIGWIPFFVLAQSIDLENRPKLGRLFVFLIVLSALGLWLQLTTHMLDFLKLTLESELRDKTGEAQRFALVYVTSTGVMPTLAGFYCLALSARVSTFWQVLATVALTVSAIPTASLAALVMLACSLFAFAVVARGWGRLLLIALAAVFALAAPLLQSDDVAKQLARITNNTATSQSNLGRLELWQQSVAILADSSPREAIVGHGVGTTNGNLGADALYTHGESSYFQAAIEGGLLGLVLRFLPLYLLFVASAYVPNQAMYWLYGIGIAICCAVAPVFALYGLQCSVGMVAGYTTGRRKRLKQARQARQARQATMSVVRASPSASDRGKSTNQSALH